MILSRINRTTMNLLLINKMTSINNDIIIIYAIYWLVRNNKHDWKN